MTQEFTTVKDILTKLQEDLIQSKARLSEREKEIENDLQDCERALFALDVQPKAYHIPNVGKTMQVPKVGDVLVPTESDQYTTIGKEYKACDVGIFKFDIIDDRGNAHSFLYQNWENFFHFKDKEPTSEDLTNLHSFQHVNQDATLDRTEGEHDNGGFATKKPYRIKTWEELLATEGISTNPNGIDCPKQYYYNFYEGTMQTRIRQQRNNAH